MARRAHQLHRGIVDIHVLERDVGIVGRHLDHDIAPQLRGLQHIGLVDRAEPLAAATRRLESDDGDARDLVLVITHRVEAFTTTGLGGAAPARLAEIDIPGQLADDQQIDVARDLGAQRGGADQLGKQLRGPQIGEQTELLAQPQDRLFGSQVTLQPVTGGIAHRAEQHRAGPLRQIERRGRQRMPLRPPAGRPHRRFLVGQHGPAGRIEHPPRLGHDFGSDPVSGQQRDQHGEGPPHLGSAPAMPVAAMQRNLPQPPDSLPILVTSRSRASSTAARCPTSRSRSRKKPVRRSASRTSAHSASPPASRKRGSGNSFAA